MLQKQQCVMSDIAISLNNVSKCYKRYSHPVDRLKEILLPNKNHADIFWALQEINLKVAQGETLGIIGQNGSGKSTLLQIIAGTLTPTTGEIGVNGRVSALLELGSGFNPEFTGRQNVFFNGQILGLSREEVEARFDEIAAFAELGDFIEQPIKTYSSGMFVRLAFAVAVSVNPEILIVDEALSVGDIYFQQKCFERIRDLKRLGTTLLFVSHESGTVYKLCNRAILMESGKVILDDKPRQVIDLYEAKLLKKRDTYSEALEIQKFPESNSSLPLKSESSSSRKVAEVLINLPEVSVKFIKLLNESDQEIESIISEEFLQLYIGLLFSDTFEDPHIGFKIRDRTGSVIFETNTFCMEQRVGKVVSSTLLEIRFRFHVPLIEGEYTVTVGVADGALGEGQFKRTLVYAHNFTVLKVLKNRNSILWSGIVNLQPSIFINKQAHV
jgi:lipopolysaccharide transport system ATP-binding protein